MNRRAGSLVLAAALGAAAGIPAAASQAATPKLTLAVAVFQRGDIRGIVSASQRGASRSATVSISVFGVGGGVDSARQARLRWDYQVVGSLQPCSRRHQGSAVFTVDGKAAQDVFVTELVRTNGPLSRARSARIYERAADGTRNQRACRGLQVAVRYLGDQTDGTGI